MALTYSEMIPLGKKAPSFSLPDVNGKQFSLSKIQVTRGLVVLFICKHCPYVVAVEERLANLAKTFLPQGIQFVAICSNDSKQYPEDSPKNLKEQAQRLGFVFPYLVDESQDVARAYGAVCTPDIFAFDADLKLKYRGRIDDNWKDAKKVSRRDLAEALHAIVNEEPVNQDQMPSMGCSIKWKSDVS